MSSMMESLCYRGADMRSLCRNATRVCVRSRGCYSVAQMARLSVSPFSSMAAVTAMLHIQTHDVVSPNDQQRVGRRVSRLRMLHGGLILSWSSHC